MLRSPDDGVTPLQAACSSATTPTSKGAAVISALLAAAGKLPAARFAQVMYFSLE